ncbi:FAD/NAD P-binding domain-containing protein [Gloeophyllum trabeum ATCC 11539]|uniref:FAD/NAD P-binding domain-containing protein n=1 Tax=Gloeophyllum trabeum (strain ATCC 11539 / FP-39264 / Madison 617) TaxID=670483 RepID=S7Q7E2_GLOTA|nr:FAD/NAD P-binding domain-containing protein [Gloeophyllum trabeum ATCC 11539]EPQ55368.1 FAD/NAD P-binding domain-containing protein [Gloeophyllum trabeum ATCC 11539]
MTQRAPETGIRVIVVGAGFAGLTAAIECHLKGHSVLVLESFPELKPLGDVISFGPNAGRIMARWGNGSVYDKLYPICHRNKELIFYKWNGEFITSQPVYPMNREAPSVNGHRGEIHEIVFNHAKELGIEIRLGCRVLEYVEEKDRAGVRVNGETLWADVVVGSDGVRSKARELVLGYVDKPKSSGYAIYRAWLDSTPLLHDPLTKHLVVNGDTHTGWLGPDVHFLAASVKDGKSFSWVCTHKDEGDIEESWSFPGKIEDALKVLDGWDPVCRRIVELTQDCVDWKLVYRDPLPTWVSKEARTCLAGDAAHPFLPTSIQGASQAMEDGVVLAACLQLAGKQNVPLAVRAYEKIRYGRVRRAQLLGEETRDMWHKADWDEVKKNPDIIKLKRDDWLFLFDCEKNTYEVWDETVKELTGAHEGGHNLLPAQPTAMISA